MSLLQGGSTHLQRANTGREHIGVAIDQLARYRRYHAVLAIDLLLVGITDELLVVGLVIVAGFARRRDSQLVGGEGDAGSRL